MKTLIHICVAVKRFSVVSYVCGVLYIYEKLGDHISMTVVWCAAVATVRFVWRVYLSCVPAFFSPKKIYNSWCTHNWCSRNFCFFFLYYSACVRVCGQFVTFYACTYLYNSHKMIFTVSWDFSIWSYNLCVCPLKMRFAKLFGLSVCVQVERIIFIRI